MTTKPRIFLSNWSRSKSQGCWGPGRKLTIMAKTPWWAAKEGQVLIFTPQGPQELAELDTLIKARREGRRDLDALGRYQRLLLARWDIAFQAGDLAPGRLMSRLPGPPIQDVVPAHSGHAAGEAAVRMMNRPEQPRRGDRGWKPVGGFLERRQPPPRFNDVLVADGDTLNCQCSAADARRGFCHRAWAGVWLQRAGWVCTLDGVEGPP